MKPALETTCLIMSTPEGPLRLEGGRINGRDGNHYVQWVLRRGGDVVGTYRYQHAAPEARRETIEKDVPPGWQEPEEGMLRWLPYQNGDGDPWGPARMVA